MPSHRMDTCQKSPPSPSTADLLVDKENQQEKEVRRKYVIIMTCLPLLLHAVSVAFTVVFVFGYLMGRNFGIHNRSRLHDAMVSLAQGDPFLKLHALPAYLSGLWVPLQSDIVAILSVLLVVVRFFHATWYMDITWKCLFILLEQTGLSVSQIRDLINFKLLLRSRSSTGFLQKAANFIPLKSLISMVLLLPLPSLFSSPLLTGSITWVPSNELFNTKSTINMATFSAGAKWDEYNESPVARNTVISMAAKYYNMLYPSVAEGRVKRVVSALQLDNQALHPSVFATHIPYFSLVPIKENHELDGDQAIRNILPALDPLSGWLNITPLANTSAFLSWPSTRQWQMPLLTEKWHPTPLSGRETAPRYTEPHAEGISFRLQTAILTRISNKNDPKYHEYAIHRDGKFFIYVFSPFEIRAGLVICPICKIESNQILTTEDGFTPTWLDIYFGVEPSVDIQPDPLAKQVLWLMPQVMDVVAWNGFFFPGDGIFPDCLLDRVYFATWSALTVFTSNANETLNIYDAVPSSKAIINFMMVFVWIGLHSLVWIAAVVFMIIERRCKHPLTLDTFISLLFLEQAEEVRTHARDSGLSEVIEVDSSKHNKEMGVLKLEYDVAKRRSKLVRWQPDSDGKQDAENSL